MKPASAGLSAAGRQQLFTLLQQLAAVADRLRPTARFLTLIGTLAALWLGWEIRDWTGASLTVTGIVVLVLAVPALVCGWLWWLLVDVCELPEIAERVLGIVRPSAPNPADGAAPVGEVFRMGGSLKKALQLAWEFDSLRGVIVGVLVLANPIFLAVLALAMAGSVVLALTALLTGAVSLLF